MNGSEFWMDEGFRANRGVSVQVSKDRRRKTDVRGPKTEGERLRRGEGEEKKLIADS